MTTPNDPREIGRFLRTLRIATQTALAHEDLVGARGEMRPTTSFQALAASGVDGWRFPAEGLVSGDGLLLAQLSQGEPASALVLQAQGAAGLSTYAGRQVLLRFRPEGEFEGVFDRDGRLEVPSDGAAGDLAELSAFDVETRDDAP